MQLSPNFSLAEFVASQEATRACIDNTPPADVLENLRETSGRLEVVRGALGHPVIISSGYRSPKLNAMIGGVPTSAHVDGYAADFLCPGFGEPSLVCARIMASGIKFDQLIQEGTWTHISFAPAMRQEVLTAKFTPAGAVYSQGIKPGGTA